MQKRGKKGLSTIVITLIIILISLVAVGIIWVVVRNVIQSGTEGIALGQFTLGADIINVNVDNSSNNVGLSVKRSAGEGEITGIKFIFSDEADSEIITEKIALGKLEEKRFTFHLTKLTVSKLISISIVPVLSSSSGKETLGSVLSKYNVQEGTSTTGGTGNQTCTPNCAGKVCGNDGCGESCGTCSTGTCNSTGSCVIQIVTGNFRYVRAGATGANNGSDWDNAYTTLPATLLRNYTYYIADGNYSSYTFDDAESGTQYITIKKATIANHGTDYGWNSGYGNGQAIFSGTSGTWIIARGFYTFDGVSNYGIKVVSSDTVENTCTICNWGNALSNITFKNLEVQAEPTGARVIWFNIQSQNFTFKNNHIHGGRSWISMSYLPLNILIENNHFSNASSSNPSLHGAGIVFTGKNLTIRYNLFENIQGTTYIEPQFSPSGIYVYGNIFKATDPNEITSQGIFAVTSTDTVNDAFIIGNTIYGIHGTSPGVSCANYPGSNCTVKNNIWQNTLTVNCNNCNLESSNILSSESVSFVNAAAGNFHLAAATRFGETLPFPYNSDAEGKNRGLDGMWDIGAYEYNGTFSGNTITALSCSQTNVQNAVNSASDGDTVLVPAGTCTWTVAGGTACYEGYIVGVCVRKGITLQGGFGGTTTIAFGSSFTRGGLQLYPDETSLINDETFEFTGFTFDGRGQLMNNEGLLNVASSGTTIMHNLKIHNNTFKNVSHTAVIVGGAVNGVIYENIFTNVGYSVRSFGRDNQGWSTFARQYGQLDNLFIEDNIINFTIDMSDVGGTDHGQGAPGYVFRYNTFNLSNTAGGWPFVIHGLQTMTTAPGYDCSIAGACGYESCIPSPIGSCNEIVDSCQQWSTIKSEYYDNTITDTPYLHAIMAHRGSWLMMFDNYIISPGSTPPITYNQYSCDSCQDPSTPAYSQHVQNSYIFNNLYNSINVPMTKGFDYCGDYSVGKPYTITENVDYWNYKSSFNGMTGIGRGTLASRPTTCTTGVGYWAIDQGEWNSKHAGADGQLYKCISTNNWQLYYTPYTYPHPLTLIP